MTDDLLPDLAHELRNPLNAIQGWLLLMKRQPADPKVVTEGLAVIERNVRLQARVLRDFTDLAALQAGGLDLDAERVEVTGAVRTALAAALVPGERADSEAALPRGPVHAMADPARLAQVLEILLRLAKGDRAGGQPPVVTVAEDAGGAGPRSCRIGIAGPAPGIGGPGDLDGPRLRAGSSLDFTLARLLAAALGGGLAATAREPGLAFTLTLPLAPP